MEIDEPLAAAAAAAAATTTTNHNNRRLRRRRNRERRRFRRLRQGRTEGDPNNDDNGGAIGLFPDGRVRLHHPIRVLRQLTVENADNVFNINDVPMVARPSNRLVRRSHQGNTELALETYPDGTLTWDDITFDKHICTWGNIRDYTSLESWLRDASSDDDAMIPPKEFKGTASRGTGSNTNNPDHDEGGESLLLLQAQWGQLLYCIWNVPGLLTEAPISCMEALIMVTSQYKEMSNNKTSPNTEHKHGSRRKKRKKNHKINEDILLLKKQLVSFGVHRLLMLANNRSRAKAEETECLFQMLLRNFPAASRMVPPTAPLETTTKDGLHDPKQETNECCYKFPHALYPLHYVCTKHAPVITSLQTFQMLVDCFPMACQLPVLYAGSSSPSQDGDDAKDADPPTKVEHHLKYAMSSRLSSSPLPSSRTTNSPLPLHCVCRFAQLTVEQFQVLVMAYPKALTVSANTTPWNTYKRRNQKRRANNHESHSILLLTPIEVLIANLFRAPDRTKASRRDYLDWLKLYYPGNFTTIAAAASESVSITTTSTATSSNDHNSTKTEIKATKLVPFMFAATMGQQRQEQDDTQVSVSSFKSDYLNVTFELLRHFIQHRNLNVFCQT